MNNNFGFGFNPYQGYVYNPYQQVYYLNGLPVYNIPVHNINNTTQDVDKEKDNNVNKVKQDDQIKSIEDVRNFITNFPIEKYDYDTALEKLTMMQTKSLLKYSEYHHEISELVLKKLSQYESKSDQKPTTTKPKTTSIITKPTTTLVTRPKNSYKKTVCKIRTDEGWKVIQKLAMDWVLGKKGIIEKINRLDDYDFGNVEHIKNGLEKVKALLDTPNIRNMFGAMAVILGSKPSGNSKLDNEVRARLKQTIDTLMQDKKIRPFLEMVQFGLRGYVMPKLTRVVADTGKDLGYSRCSPGVGLTEYTNKDMSIAYATDRKKEDQIGTIAHEMTHGVAQWVYKNGSNPYVAGNKEGVLRYNKIYEQLKTGYGVDEIFSLIEGYEKKDYHSEIIARAIQILATYGTDKGWAVLKNSSPILYNAVFDFIGDCAERVEKVAHEVMCDSDICTFVPMYREVLDLSAKQPNMISDTDSVISEFGNLNFGNNKPNTNFGNHTFNTIKEGLEEGYNSCDSNKAKDGYGNDKSFDNTNEESSHLEDLTNAFANVISKISSMGKFKFLLPDLKDPFRISNVMSEMLRYGGSTKMVQGNHQDAELALTISKAYQNTAGHRLINDLQGLSKKEVDVVVNNAVKKVFGSNQTSFKNYR